MTDAHVILGVDSQFGKPKGADETPTRVNAIPLVVFGGTVRNIIDNIVAQINARDYQMSQNARNQMSQNAQNTSLQYNPKIVENLVGIEQSVFRTICMSDNAGPSTLFNDVHIIVHSNINWVGI